MIKKFQYSFEELNICKKEIEELLGFKADVIPEPFRELISRGLGEASEHCNIKGGYKVFSSINVSAANNTITIENQEFFPAKVVITQLKKANSAALVTCTAGKEISDYSQEISEQGDPIYSYILDVIGSVTVEKAMDKIQKELYNEVKKTGMSISDRYSPGYCEWSVGEQQKLFSLLPDKFCGVALSSSSLMTPIKSVSGIIGIGPDLKQKGYLCYWCTDRNCIYGKIKRKKTA